MRADGGKAAHAHLRWLNPFPANLGDVLKSYDRVLIPEMNMGQLLQLVRARYLVDAVGYNRVTGKPFKAGEIARRGRGDAVNLNDPLTRAVTETLVVAAATLLMLFVVASYVQNVFGMIIASLVAAAGFLIVARRAKKLMEGYG